MYSNKYVQFVLANVQCVCKKGLTYIQKMFNMHKKVDMY